MLKSSLWYSFSFPVLQEHHSLFSAISSIAAWGRMGSEDGVALGCLRPPCLIHGKHVLVYPGGQGHIPGALQPEYVPSQASLTGILRHR